jgi:hypothetical protein
VTDPAATPPPVAPTAAPTSFGVSQILALVGSAVIAISSWLDWVKEIDGAPGESAHEGPAKFLIDYTSEPGGLSIGTLLIIVGVVGIVGAFLAQARILTLIAGIGGVVVSVLFMYQVKSIIDDFDFDAGFGDIVGIGAYLALIGGVVALVGGIMSLRST